MNPLPITLISSEELIEWRSQVGKGRIGFVPTMGALHEGHGSLIKAVRERCERTLVSIFVNPLQFGPNEDFDRYPRTFKADLELLRTYGADAVFLPNVSGMYPEHFQTKVINLNMANRLCGLSRPGHFEGVLTVVLKLFNKVKPDIAVFGKKDYQQWRLISRMVKDLDLSLEIVGCEILRDKDGLAMSSRNRYLSDEDRSRAVCLSKGLFAAREAYLRGERSVQKLKAKALDFIGKESIDLEYLEICNREDLELSSDPIHREAVMLVAAKLGSTRLIDNIEL